MKFIVTTMGMCVLLTGTTRLIAQDETNKAQGELNKAQEESTNALHSGLKSQTTKEMKATVQKIDKDTREITLKDEQGNTATIQAPETVRNFDQIKVGDVVTAKYHESVAIGVRKSDEPPSATGREIITRAPLGERPGAMRKSTTQITATIEKIDRDQRELTLKGPQGNTTVVKVPEEVKKFDQLKEGDQVVVTATESVALSVSSPEK